MGSTAWFNSRWNTHITQQHLTWRLACVTLLGCAPYTPTKVYIGVHWRPMGATRLRQILHITCDRAQKKSLDISEVCNTENRLPLGSHEIRFQFHIAYQEMYIRQNWFVLVSKEAKKKKKACISRLAVLYLSHLVLPGEHL